MAKPTPSSSGKREGGALETFRTRLWAAVGVRWRWLSRERFGPPPDESSAWRDIERTRLVLPTSEQPDVSIVIPVYGQLATTWACLRSLTAEPAGATFEVLVADDRS